MASSFPATVEPGQIVASSLSAPVLFTLAEDLTEMELQVDIDEADVGQISGGEVAAFTVEAFGDREFDAQITQLRFSPETIEGVVTYKAILSVDNTDRALRPGMTATSRITVEEIDDALTVANAALRYAPAAEDEGSSGGSGLLGLLIPRPPSGQPAATEPAADGTRTVWVLRDGAPAAVAVRTGSSDGDRTVIVERGTVGRRCGDHGSPDGNMSAATIEAREAGRPLVAFRGVTKVYGTGDAAVAALRGIDLAIDRGEFVAIMGPSGSGKSTAMNILGCLDTPTDGTYRFDGVDVSHLDPDQHALLRRHFIGFIFQGFNLLARTSALENVELPLLYGRVAAAERRQRAAEALAKVGLADRAGHAPNELSGGQQQRVAIARAIVTRPAIILADEPTGNLDTAMSEEIMRLLSGLNRDEGITIVMVTHEPDMAAFADRMIRFVDGRIAYDGAAAKAA